LSSILNFNSIIFLSLFRDIWSRIIARNTFFSLFTFCAAFRRNFSRWLCRIFYGNLTDGLHVSSEGRGGGQLRLESLEGKSDVVLKVFGGSKMMWRLRKDFQIFAGPQED
jgi:hypothetical protein